MLTYGFNIWIEVTVLPFLAVMAIFMYSRYATKAEMNRRFRLLTFTTFTTTLLEVISTLLVDGWGHREAINLAAQTLYHATVYLNAYALMRYVEAYVQVEDKKFDSFNKVLLFSSFVMLIMNAVPGTGGFFFIITSDGGLLSGPYNTLWRSVYTLYFAVMALWLQISNKQSYAAKSQYILLNSLIGLLVVANIVQAMFIRMVLFTNAVSCIVLYVTFFYYESPTYRRMHTVEKELEETRVLVERSTRIKNAATRAKSDFLANTSHEIRTPMNAILGMNEMILKESKDKEIHEAALDIRSAGNHLLAIINNILDISKIESGKMELYKADYHIWQMIRDIEDSHSEVMREKNLEFVLDVNKEIPEHLYGDEDRVRQAIDNLIDNAIKYTQKGSIKLSITAIPDSHSITTLVIAVKDTGIGIRDEDLGKLFRSFERVNLNETQNIRGAGLGLTLVRYLVELMDGKISAQSEYGKGSVFTMEIPQLLAQEGFLGTIGEYEKMLAQENENVYGVAREDDRPFTCPEAKLLVVDDTPVNLVVVKGMLKETEAQVETAESGEDCLELLKTNHYDIIFLDHKMPGMDGVETLKAARELDGPSQLSKYIALTANSGSGLREEYISLGFNDYLPKPMKLVALKKILAKYLPENLKIRS